VEKALERAEIFTAYLLIPEDNMNTILKHEWTKESLNPFP